MTTTNLATAFYTSVSEKDHDLFSDMESLRSLFDSASTEYQGMSMTKRVLVLRRLMLIGWPMRNLRKPFMAHMKRSNYPPNAARVAWDGAVDEIMEFLLTRPSSAIDRLANLSENE